MDLGWFKRWALGLVRGAVLAAIETTLNEAREQGRALAADRTRDGRWTGDQEAAALELLDWVVSVVRHGIRQRLST